MNYATILPLSDFLVDSIDFDSDIFIYTHDGVFLIACFLLTVHRIYQSLFTREFRSLT